MVERAGGLLGRESVRGMSGGSDERMVGASANIEAATDLGGVFGRMLGRSSCDKVSHCVCFSSCAQNCAFQRQVFCSKILRLQPVAKCYIRAAILA